MLSSGSLQTALLVAVGGACGALLRAGLARRAARLRVQRVPFGLAGATLAANLLACFLLGSLSGLAERPWFAGDGRPLLSALAATGFCGALSTFSTLCAGARDLWRDAGAGHALAYLLAHLLAGPVAYVLGRSLTG